MERKIYEDIDKAINEYLESMKKTLYENLPKLPNEELPFMEPHLRAIYFQAYYLMAMGFYNTSLVLCGILLENLVKEKLFMNEISDEELEKMNFGQAINKTKNMGLLSEEEIKFLESKKDSLRNPYVHYNKMKLSEGIYYPVWKIPSGEIVPKLIAPDKRVKDGEITEAEARPELINCINPELMSSKELRPISQTAKSEMEKQFGPQIFCEVDKFTREFAVNHFEPKEQD